MIPYQVYIYIYLSSLPLPSPPPLTFVPPPTGESDLQKDEYLQDEMREFDRVFDSLLLTSPRYRHRRRDQRWRNNRRHQRPLASTSSDSDSESSPLHPIDYESDDSLRAALHEFQHTADHFHHTTRDRTSGDLLDDLLDDVDDLGAASAASRGKRRRASAIFQEWLFQTPPPPLPPKRGVIASPLECRAVPPIPSSAAAASSSLSVSHAP